MSFDSNFINIFKALSKKDQGVWEHMKASGKRAGESAASTRKVFRTWQKSGKPFDASHSFHRDNPDFGEGKEKTVPEGSRLKFVGKKDSGGRWAFVDKEGKVVRYLDTPENEARQKTLLDESRGIGSSKRAKKVRQRNIRNAEVYDWKRGRRATHPDEAGSPEDRASRPTTPSPETPASRDVTPSPEKVNSPEETSRRIRRAGQGGNNPAGGREVTKPPKTREESTIKERKPKQGELDLNFTKEYVMTETINIYKAFGIQSMTRPESNISEALDLYDEVLQKADMDWDNVSEEELVQLEKLFGIKNPLRREKSTKEKTERAGLEYANGGGKKEAPNLGFSRADQRKKREAAVKAQRAKSRAEVDASIKQPGRFASRVDALSRGVRRRGSQAKERGGQALRSGASATRSAAGTAASATKREVGAGARATGRVARGVGEAVEPAGLQRRRGGGPEARRQKESQQAWSQPTGSEGPPGRSRSSRIAGVARGAGGAIGGAAKAEWGRMKDEAARGGVRGFIKPKTEAPKATASTGSKPKWGEAGFASARGDWKAMEKANMQKAAVSLQKYLDDCGCEGDSLMQYRTKDQQDKAERRQGGAYANKERDSEHRIEYPVGDTSEGGHLGGWGTGKENYEAEMKYLRRRGRGGTDYPDEGGSRFTATPPSESMKRGVLADAKRTAKRKQRPW